MRTLVFLAAVFAVLGAVTFALSLTPTSDSPLPTLMVLPTITPSSIPTETLAPSATPSPTLGRTPTPTTLQLPSPSPTLSIRVLTIAQVMPGVLLAPSATPFPDGAIVLSSPPDPVEPLPNATDSTSMLLGWHRFESDHPSVDYQPAWAARQIPDASRGQYHRTDQGGSAFFTFEGEALRVRYVAAENIGRFAVWVDGVLLDELDGHADTLHFPVSRVYLVGGGGHRLELRALSGVVGVDAIDVFRAPPHTLILPPVTETPSPEPIDALRVLLVDAPPTPTPSGQWHLTAGEAEQAALRCLFVDRAIAPRLMLGGSGQVAFTDGTPSRLRAAPNTSATVVGQMPEGTRFSVMGAPVCGMGYRWWPVQTPDGLSGWVAEGTPSEYWVEPVVGG
jgi:hypothetical protein